MEFFQKGEFFPPVEHQDRLQRYRDNKMLFQGKHKELISKYNLNRRSNLYISVNLAGIIAKKSADFLIGDGVSVSAGKEDNSPEQVAFERIEADNDLDITLYESALSNAVKGDSFFRLRYGQEFGGQYSSAIDPYRVRIETLAPEYVFPETPDHSNKIINAFHVAIPVKVDQSKSNNELGGWELQVESHYPGYIDYRRFALAVIRAEYDGTPYEWKISGQLGETERVNTGVPFPLIVHVPNYATEDHWEGQDDLTELRPLFDELNNRLSQIASIMDKHSDPALAVPPGTLVEDEYGRPIFRVADSKVYEVDKQEVMPQYITWNGQLTEAYTEIDKLMSMILIIAEIPEVALGAGDSGTSGSSGLAIKWRMNSLLSKIKRKRKYYEKGLKRVFTIAQQLEHSLGYADYEITAPKFEFTDGLPQDEMEQTTIALQQTGGAVLKSRKTAIMQLFKMTEEQAGAEIARIEEEQEALAEREQTASPNIFNDLGFTQDAEEPVEYELEPAPDPVAIE